MIIIPARLESSRFARKVLADVGGLPMVVRTARAVQEIDDVVVAADSDLILSTCKEYNIKAVLTSTAHKSGTDRVHECAQKLSLDNHEIIINVQADEPFLHPEVIHKLQLRLKELKQHNRDFIMGSCYNEINDDAAKDVNLVKVVLDSCDNAIYFSRAKIPFNRSNTATYFGHIGIYGFTKKSLQEFCNLTDAPIENIEKLEQLRAIYHSKPISMVKVSSTSFGIDTKEDLQRAIKQFL